MDQSVSSDKTAAGNLAVSNSTTNNSVGGTSGSATTHGNAATGSTASGNGAPSGTQPSASSIQAPKRNFSLEFFVGLFMLASLASAAYLAIGLGGLELNSSNHYTIFAEFDNVSGLKSGAPIEIAGVPVGEVANIQLSEATAVVELRMNRDVPVHEDDIASIRTQGIIGDRYVKISRGGSPKNIPVGATLTETESVVDLEDIIGKLVHNFTGGDKDGDAAKKGEKKAKSDSSTNEIE